MKSFFFFEGKCLNGRQTLLSKVISVVECECFWFEATENSPVPLAFPEFPKTPRAAGLGYPTLANEIPVRHGCLNVLLSNGSEGAGSVCACGGCIH